MNFCMRYLSLWFILLVLVHINCANSPNAPGKFGSLNLNFHITGHKISGNTSLVKSTESLSFSRIIIEVYPSGSAATDNVSARESIARLELELTPNDIEFEGSLEVPAGENHLVIVRLFQTDFSTPASTGDASEKLTFCGRKTISVAAGSTVEANIDLYPLPIRGRRVVIHIGSIEMKADASLKLLPVSVANLDSLRGIQFDMYLNSQYIKLNSTQKTERTAAFSDVNFNYLESYNDEVRVIIFDRTKGAALLPIKDECAIPDPIVYLGISLSPETDVTNRISIPLTISRVIVTSTAFNPLEVWVVDGELILLEQ